MADNGSYGLGDAWAENLASVHDFVTEAGDDLWLFIDQEAAALGDVFTEELATFDAIFMP